jgi:hypothetical protein
MKILNKVKNFYKILYITKSKKIYYLINLDIIILTKIYTKFSHILHHFTIIFECML